jgi:PAS domain S-box-containing protein
MKVTGQSILLSISCFTVYLLAAVLSTFLEIPLALNMPIWLGAGVALAIILQKGLSYIWIVFLANIFINWFIAPHAPEYFSDLHKLAITLAIATGATVQAMVSALLIRATISLPNHLEQERDIGLIVLLGGPVGCIISATSASLLLAYYGLIAGDDFLLKWFSWWIADSLGVVIVTPLFLLIHNDKINSERKRNIILPVAVLSSLIAAIFFYVRDVEKKAVSSEFAQIAQHQADLLRKNITRYDNILKSMKHFFTASQQVDRDEFQNFVESSLREQKAIKALEWVPKILHQERSEHERKGQEFQKNYRITEIGKKGMIAEEETQYYFPIFYIEPLEGNEEALGFDLSSETARNQALQDSVNYGASVATSSLNLVQDRIKQNSFLIFHPVFKNDSYIDTIDDRYNALEGFVVGAFRVNEIVKTVMDDDSQKYMSLHIYDTYVSDSSATIYGEYALESDFSYFTTMTVAGRQWGLNFHPTASFLRQYKGWRSWSVIVTGFSFAALLQIFLIVSTARTEEIRRVVKQKTRALRDANRFQKLMMEQNPDLIFVKDENYRIIEANKSFLSVYPEDKRDRVIGYTTLEDYAPDERDAFLEKDREAFEKGESRTLETLTFPDGKKRMLFTQKIKFENIDGKEFILGIGRDVTEREALISDLRKSNSELDDFAYIASHDLKEPLRGIHNHSRFLYEDYNELFDEKAKERIKRILWLTQRLEKLINDLLYYSKLGRRELAYKNTNLNEVVEDIIMTFEEEEDQASIHIKGDLPTIICDKVRITELLRNLITNGLKYNESDPKMVEVETISEDANTITIGVKDNGIGIATKHHENIFKIFRRLHNKEAYGGGTGSGLTFVKKIARQHGGDISVTSSLGEGSRFILTLKKDCTS